jgi:protein phosphatase
MRRRVETAEEDLDASVRVVAAMRTDVGRVRDRNEDCAHVDPARRFVIVADGMGGRNAGDVASATAVDVVQTCLAASSAALAAYAAAPSPPGRMRIQSIIDRAVRLANDTVYARSRNEPDKDGMGTTLEVVVVLGLEAFIAHVGDGRTYLLRDREAIQQTRDHSIAELMRTAGTLTDDEARVSPLRAALSNAIGVTASISIDHLHLDLRTGDRLLVCSDGLYEYFAADQLAAYATGIDIKIALAALVLEARARGGHDNITGVVLEIVAAEEAVEPIVHEASRPH